MHGLGIVMTCLYQSDLVHRSCVREHLHIYVYTRFTTDCETVHTQHQLPGLAIRSASVRRWCFFLRAKLNFSEVPCVRWLRFHIYMSTAMPAASLVVEVSVSGLFMLLSRS